jgi:D-3-phosphoglycerate dehydrogenase / 2-oxoglutarate reductase
MFKIQTLNAISNTGLSQFPHDLYEISAEMQNPDAILVRSGNMHDMKLAEAVKVVGRAGAGVNNIPVAELTKIGIPVLNTPGANANAVRELVLAGMLLASRNICQAWNYVSQLKIPDAELDKQIEKDKKQFVGFELMGKTLGVVGLGSIGVKVANAAMHLGMRVIGFDPTITVSRAWELSSSVQQARNIDDVLKESDFVTFHVPLTPETKNMLSKARIELLKDGVVILNFARDGILDNEALLEALNAKKVFAYVTDFPSPKMKDHPRVISLPHLGASTSEAEENCAVMIVKQVRDFLETGAITNSANFPAIEMPLSPGGFRLAVVNRNVPNMVAQISAALADAKLNILSLLNKSRDDIAYTLIDVNSTVNEGVLKAIGKIDGVVHVRKI